MPADRSVTVSVLHRSRLFRDCLASTLSRQKAILASPVDHSAPDLLADLVHAPGRIVLLDAALPERQAIGIVRWSHEQAEPMPVILIGSSSSRDAILECLSNGVEGCIAEDCSLTDLLDAINRVSRGVRVCSAGLVDGAIQELSAAVRRTRWREATELAALTPRELEVLRLMARNLSNRAIAHRLFISLPTVKNHLHNSCRRLQVNNRREAVRPARLQRLLAPVRDEKPIVRDS